MKRLILERVAYLPTVTLGYLSGEIIQTYVTVERPWRKNAVDISCIVEGVFPAQIATSPKRGYDVIWIDNVPGRTNTQIHIANTPEGVKGCIGVGMYFRRDYSGVANSRAAFDELMSSLRSNGWFKFEIVVTKTHFGTLDIDAKMP